jgi:cell wall-associated NlpC family hydrolase
MNKIIDIVKLGQLAQNAVTARVRYGLGCKKPAPITDTRVDFPKIDCSGYIRWLLAASSGILIPDGSVCQHQYFLDNYPLQQILGNSWKQPQNYNKLYMHFLDPGTQADHIGHVWLTIHNHTIESCGGQGPACNSIDRYTPDATFLLQ